MDGTEANRRNCTRSDAGADSEQSGSKDRVTLKKEIGLMSACAIIIGTFIPHVYFRGRVCARALHIVYFIFCIRPL